MLNRRLFGVYMLCLCTTMQGCIANSPLCKWSYFKSNPFARFATGLSLNPWGLLSDELIFSVDVCAVYSTMVMTPSLRGLAGVTAAPWPRAIDAITV